MAVLNPPPGKAARLYAATRAALNDGRPAFGVRVLRPGEPTDLERARAAYNDPSAYPLPDPGNWLSQLASMDPKSLPKHVQNWLAGMAASAAQDPMSTVLPFLGSKGAGVARAALVGEEGTAGAAELSQKMKGVNQYLGQRRTEFAAGLEPPPTRSLPVKQYTTENVGPRQVNVVGETVHAPERITLEQARAAGVEGPVPYETPSFRFTRQGPRVEIHNPLPMDEASRMARANEQGFTMDAYKGYHPYDWKTGKEITEMRTPTKHMGGGYAGFFSDSPEVAGKFAKIFGESRNEAGAVLPAKLRMRNPLVIDMSGKPAAYAQFGGFGADAAELRARMEAGLADDAYDGIVLKNTEDEGTVFVPKHSKDVRSKFAKFDPSKSDSADLLAGVALPIVGAAAVAASSRKK